MAKKLLRTIAAALLVPVAANLILLNRIFSKNIMPSEFFLTAPAVKVFLTILILFLWAALQVFPFRDKEQAGRRLRILMGGRRLCFLALYGLAVQVLIFLIFSGLLLKSGIPPAALAVNTVFALVSCFLMLWNGILRIFFTSTRLRLRMRVFMILAMWIPLLNLFVLLWALRMVHAEYDFACYKDAVRKVRAESGLCKTRYPLIMVHGIGFRDLRYFNYWGRIPRELTRYGASVYYGNQEALGTIIRNAEDIRKKVMEVIRDTGCEKVNIIAHSKGGLDSRYAISRLGLAPYVASLTTMSTPHHGCRFVDYAIRLPEGMYRFVSRLFDRTFSRFGDKSPDFYTATHQFSTESSRLFNEEVPDCPGVYYQSYASKMKDCLSDPLLSVPYCMIHPLEGDNDGLVSTVSAHWGNFRGVIENRHHRGISHGDMIDLKREDYRGFDVVECYVKIVSELAQKGF